MLNQGKPTTRVLVGTVLWTVGIVMFGSPVWAGFIDFNPTGSAASPAITIGGIDIAPGNALARGAVPLREGQTFELDFQASVAGIINTKGFTDAPMGLNTKAGFQLTAVGSFTEVVTSLSSNNTVATFSLAPVQSPNSFFELYYNPAVVANSLAGTGFNQGTLILSAKPSATLASVGLFTLSTGSMGPITQQFDKFNTDPSGKSIHYPNIDTVKGSGTALISADVTYFNPDFFKTAVSQFSFNSSLVTPFQEVSPSMQFVGTPGGAPPNVPANIGAVNGFSGPDFQFQADANVSFTPAAVIPEPASIILAGLGFASIVCIHAWKKK